MLIEQISVFVENQPGRLADITGVLANEGIDIRALSIADTTDFGILRLIVNDPEKASAALRENGVMVSLTQVVAVRLGDQPGSLHKVLSILRSAEIPVEYAYAFITHKESDAYVILRVENNEGAIKILLENDIPLLKAADLYGL